MRGASVILRSVNSPAGSVIWNIMESACQFLCFDHIDKSMRIDRSDQWDQMSSGIRIDNRIKHFLFFFFITADAAERKYFGSCAQIKRLVMQSPLKDEIKKARFKLVTKKSRISVFLIKNGLFRTAFAFLYLCRIIKNISGRKE